jgi:hypothetical protein
MTTLFATRPADATYVVFAAPRWEADPTSMIDLPGALIPLNVGQGTASYGALFVATFSAEALAEASNSNGVVTATVFFGSTQSEPASDNHRFATARGGPEWSSHTIIRTLRVEPGFNVRDVSAQVKIGGSAGVHAGIQNWVLKVERFNI